MLSWYGFGFEEFSGDTRHGYAAKVASEISFTSPFYIVATDWISLMHGVLSASTGQWSHFWGSTTVAAGTTNAYSPTYSPADIRPTLSEYRFMGFSLHQ